MNVKALPEYRIWTGMIRRCYNPNASGYKNYGGRGIKVCIKWRKSFLAFYEDMGPRPSGLSLERIDNNESYSAKNCKWASASEQNLNRRNTVFIIYNDKKIPLMKVCKELNLEYKLVSGRLRLGWSELEALFKPAFGHGGPRHSNVTWR